MKALWIAAILTALAGPALAQLSPTFPIDDGTKLTPEQKAKLEANERAARAASSRVPTPKVSDDPWADVRATPAPAKSATKHKSGK
jgi:hypothetical protein